MDISLIDILTSFKLNNDPEDITVQDVTDLTQTAKTLDDTNQEYTQPAITASQVKGNLALTAPDGVKWYETLGFGTPDIDRSASDVKSGIALYKDVNDNILAGIYKFNYKIQVTNERFDFQIKSIDLSANTITLSGQHKLKLDLGTSFEIINSVPNTNDGVYTIASISETSTETYVELNEALTHEQPTGEFKVLATIEYEQDFEYTYDYVAPEIKLSVTHNCKSAEFQSTDNTDYGDYNVVNRTHTIQHPQDLDAPPADVVQNLKTVSLSDLYTNSYLVTLATVIQYITEDGLMIDDTLEGSEPHIVECNDCLCEIYTCIDALRQKFITAITENSRDVARLTDVMMQVLIHFMLYGIAEACSNYAAQDEHLAKIKALVNAENCQCEPASGTSKKSVQVVPVTSGALQTIYNELVNQIFDGAGVPSPAIHDDGDYYIDTVNGNLYHKESGSWILKISIIGPAGIQGIQGLQGIAGPSGATTLLAHLTAEVLNGTGFSLFPGYTDIVNTFSATPDEFLEVGDMVKITTSFKTDNDILNSGGFRLIIGGNNIDCPIASGKDYYRIEAYILRESNVQVHLKTLIYRGKQPTIGGPDYVSSTPGDVYESNTKLSVPDMDAADLTIAVHGDAQSLQDITAQDLIISEFKKKV